MKFPLFRKYSNEKSYFQINDENSFTELKSLPGDQWETNDFHANNYFDRLYIEQLIEAEPAHFVAIEAEEYNSIKSRLKKPEAE
ncbi:MAG: hypothetical protein WD048_11210 [Chitinophagales bacterium]